MKIDAHYYAVLSFCRACGFKKESAGVVAYASQFVDDARINHIVLKERPKNEGIKVKEIQGEFSFLNMATCHTYTRVKTFNYSAMTHNTCAFHFVPSCDGPNFPRKLKCKEESPVILDILKDAKKEDDLIKLGIVLHAYADTFSHQGFSGLISKVNDIKNCKTIGSTPWIWADKLPRLVTWLCEGRDHEFIDKLTDTIIPGYGHGQAMVYPDLPYLRWSYEYDFTDEFSTQYTSTGEINNRKRFKKAFERIKGHLQEYLKNYPKYVDDQLRFDAFSALFDTLLARKNDNQRIKNWKKVMVDHGLFLPSDTEYEYHEDRWLKAAFKNFERKKFHRRKVTGVELSEEFENSHWYQYYKAVKWYKEKFFGYCKDHGLEIPR